jgi:hypothetical protein
MFDYDKSAEFLTKCQVKDSQIRGTVCPWVLNEGLPPREDLHDTLEAVYVWSRNEHFDKYRENIIEALEYVKKRFEWFKRETEPLKSYDAIYLLLASKNYLRSENSRELEMMRDYAEQYLTKYILDNPETDKREYSNSCWKAAIFHLSVSDDSKKRELVGHWLEKGLEFSSPNNEEKHLGMGYQYHHDFVSTFGTKLLVSSLAKPEIIPSNISEFYPTDFVYREIDPNSFNSSILTGLCALRNSRGDRQDDKLSLTIDKIKAKLEAQVVDGGIRRGDYFPVRESWSTFFLYFAELMCDGKEILNK